MMEWQPSACLIALRPLAQDKGFEVLLALRAEGLALAPGHHVFPGGGIEPVDADLTVDSVDVLASEQRFRRAALREFNEEVAVGQSLALEPDQLRYVAEWKAPEFLAKRYLTRFYLALLPDFSPTCDATEIVSAQWYQPENAINLHTLGHIQLMFPTLAILDWLASFDRLSLVQAAINKSPLASVCPVLKTEGEKRFLSIGTGTGYRIERWAIG